MPFPEASNTPLWQGQKKRSLCDSQCTWQPRCGQVEESAMKSASSPLSACRAMLTVSPDGPR